MQRHQQVSVDVKKGWGKRVVVDKVVRWEGGWVDGWVGSHEWRKAWAGA